MRTCEKIEKKKEVPWFPSPPICTWKDDGGGNYDTSCKERFVIIEGTPTENGMEYCCYCGRYLRESS